MYSNICVNYCSFREGTTTNAILKSDLGLEKVPLCRCVVFNFCSDFLKFLLHLYTELYIHKFLYIYVCLSVYLPVCLSVHYLSILIGMYVYVSTSYLYEKVFSPISEFFGFSMTLTLKLS